MPEPHCFGSLQVCATRVAALDAAGTPLAGTDNGYVTDALIDLNTTVDLSEADEFELKNGCGAVCQTFRDCDRIKRFDLAAEFCELDSELISLLIQTGELFTDTGTGDAIGFEFPNVDVACPNGVSYEIWTLAWDRTAQAIPPFLAPSIAYWHWVFPKVRWQIGDLTFENEIQRVPLNGVAEVNPGMDADGPFNDWNADVVLAGGITNAAGFFLDDTIPTANCGFIPVPAQS